MTIKSLARSATYALLLAAATSAAAQQFPNKLVRLINPYAAGGPADLLARELARGLSDALGQQVIVENKPGAGTAIGADFVAKAPPDGYTLLVGTAASHVVTPLLDKKISYDGLRDFTAGRHVRERAECAGRASVGAGQVGARLIAYAKAIRAS